MSREVRTLEGMTFDDIPPKKNEDGTKREPLGEEGILRLYGAIIHQALEDYCADIPALMKVTIKNRLKRIGGLDNITMADLKYLDDAYMHLIYLRDDARAFLYSKELKAEGLNPDYLVEAYKRSIDK